jgi:hypothetical protein
VVEGVGAGLAVIKMWWGDPFGGGAPPPTSPPMDAAPQLINAVNVPGLDASKIISGVYRQGNPRLCSARRQDGKPCGRWAIRGGTMCGVHGGSAPQVRAAARRRYKQASDAVAAKEIGIALDGPPDSPVTLAAIKDCQDRAGIPAKAQVSVELKPWERLLGDIVGIATISRAEHRARQGLAADGPPYVIDAEVVDSPSPRGPETAALPAFDELRAPGPVDILADESAGPSGRAVAARGR